MYRKNMLARALLVGMLGWGAMAPAFAQDIIDTVAGNGQDAYAGEGGPATSHAIGSIYDAAFDPQGNLVFASQSQNRVYRVDRQTGVLQTIAGTGSRGFGGDGGNALEASFSDPLGVEFDAAGNLFVADVGNLRVRRIDVETGIITTVAGSGQQGSDGDGGAATAATFFTPYKLAVDAAGNLYISDFSAGRVRRVEAATGVITTAVLAQGPWAIAMDHDGDLLVGEFSPGRILSVEGGTGPVTVVAGGGGGSADDIPATSAAISAAGGVAVDAAGNLFISDRYGYRVRRVDIATGLIRTVAGTGESGFAGDGEPAEAAQFREPDGLALDASGRVHVADISNFRIRAFTGGVPASSADLSVETTAADEQVLVGAQLGYGVTVSNAGPDSAESAGVGFALDAELSDLQVQGPEGWTCDEPTVGEGNTVTSCNGTGIAAEDNAEFVVTATAPASASGRSVTLTAAATSQTPDQDEDNNSDSASIGVNPVADVAVTLEGPRKVAFGAKATYTVTLSNAGPSVAPDPVVVLRSDMSARSVSLQAPAGWQCLREGSAQFLAFCTPQSETLGEERPVFTLTVGSAGKLSASSFTVSAEAYSEASDPVPANNAKSLRAFRYAFSY
jgi:sugar lactone lactonase YvrE